MAQKGDSKKMVRGVRNRNPLNIRYGSPWEGLLKNSKDIDRSFCVFRHVKFGIRAGAKLFLNYKRFYDIDTIRGIVDRFAPPEENNTTAYIEDVCKRMGKHRDEHLDLYDANVMLALLKAMIRHECGYDPYEDEEIKNGMLLAGVS